MRPGVSRLNTLSQVDRIGIPFSGRPVPCTPSLWQNYVTESQIRCPDSEDVPRDKVLDSEPAQLKPRCPIVKLPWREWERSREDLMLNEQTLPDVVSVTANNDDLVTMQFGRVDQASTWVGSGHFYHLIGRYLKLFHQSEVVYFQIFSATSIFDKSRLCLKFNLNHSTKSLQNESF